MARIYFYKLTTDNGGAPHVNGGLLSLAICKPMIRSTAKRGDLIFGFAANALYEDNRLIYAAQVTEKLDGGDYYSAAYASRGDCIYERHNDHFVRRDGALYHEGPAHLVHDLGDPPYPRANVLLSNIFSYFGKNGSADYKDRHRAIKHAVEGLTQGHRVEHATGLRGELQKLAAEVLTTRARVLGAPTSAPDRGVCFRDEEVHVVDEDCVRTHC